MTGKVARYSYSDLSMSFRAGKSDSDYHDESGSGNELKKKSGILRTLSRSKKEDDSLTKEDAIIKSLGTGVECEKALRYLEIQLKGDSSYLMVQNKISIFQGFAQVLSANNENIQIACMKLIAKIIPQLGPDVDQCLQFILPKVVVHIGSATVLQKKSTEALRVCMRHSADVHQILKIIAQAGIRHKDLKTRKRVIDTFPALLFPELRNENFFDVVLALVENFSDTVSDNFNILKTLSLVQEFVGGQRFSSFIDDLPSPSQSSYNEMMRNLALNSKAIDASMRKNVGGRRIKVKSNYLTPSRSPDTSQLQFFSKITVQNLSSADDKVREQAVRDVKKMLENTKYTAGLEQIIMQMISLLHPVAGDSDSHISCGALQALGMITQKLGPSIRPYVKSICSAVGKHMARKDLIKVECMKVLLGLEEVTDVGFVLEHFWRKLQHKQAKIREETINLIIASVLKFQFCNSNISILKLSRNIAPVLADSNLRVRHAALECVAALGTYYSTDSSEMKTIITEINRMEHGITSAVHARLSRNQPPTLKDGVLVEHAIIPRSPADIGSPQSTDVRWVLTAQQPNMSSIQTTYSPLSSGLKRSVIDSKDSTDNVSNPRVSSAGKRGVFPWATEESSALALQGYSPAKKGQNVYVEARNAGGT